jgi:hypothetical protein
MLSVREGARAIEFYKAAFGAVELYRLQDDAGKVVAQLSVAGAEFWLADESPEHFNFSPESLGGGSVRLVMIVEDPDAAFDRADCCRSHSSLARPRGVWLALGTPRRSVRTPLGNRQALSTRELKERFLNTNKTQLTQCAPAGTATLFCAALAAIRELGIRRDGHGARAAAIGKCARQRDSLPRRGSSPQR